MTEMATRSREVNVSAGTDVLMTCFARSFHTTIIFKIFNGGVSFLTKNIFWGKELNYVSLAWHSIFFPLGCSTMRRDFGDNVLDGSERGEGNPGKMGGSAPVLPG